MTGACVVVKMLMIHLLMGVFCGHEANISRKRSIIDEFLRLNENEQCTNAETTSEEDKLDGKVSSKVEIDNPTPDQNFGMKSVMTENMMADHFVYNRVKLPFYGNIKTGDKKNITLPGQVDAVISVLSTDPLIFEVENFIDEEDCDLMIEFAKSKKLKKIQNKIADIHLKDSHSIFQEWDYDQDGVISKSEITLLPALAAVRYSEEDADDMFFLLKMDRNGDGEISFEELKNTDFGAVKAYFTRIRNDKSRQRNISSVGAWVWHDGDELLKFQEEGYFEKYHDRISTLTGIPKEIVEESEPIQVRYFTDGEFELSRHDSEPPTKDLSCCLYGDVGKVCRLCRYISMSIFLNDVDGGGELVFPLANSNFHNILENSGEWRGYYIYAKTTGHKFYFKVNMAFEMDGANRVFTAQGMDESGDFVFKHGIIIDDTVKFEKSYRSDSSNSIRYQGKLVGGTRITGYWWSPGQKRLRGSFFMWDKQYDIFSSRAIDETNTIEGCSKTGLVIKPKKGKAVFWYNHRINPRDGMVGELNQEAMHAQCEVKGDAGKWIATTWINIVGDGDLDLRAWRKGSNLFLDYKIKKSIFDELGTNDPKLEHEAYESEYLIEITGKNHTKDQLEGYYKHKPASNALQAITLLFNDMNTEQLRLIASNVHKKLGLTCIPLTMRQEDKIALVDGSVE